MMQWIYHIKGFLTKLMIYFLFVSVLPATVRAQNITNYTFNSSSGTFTALTSPTNPTFSGGNLDDGSFNNIPIGFDFWYMGIKYTTVSASTNGWLIPGASITDYSTVNYTNNLATVALRPVIAPLWDDLDIGATTNVSYKTTGTAGSRVFTIQYLNMKWYYLEPGSVISFQARLYESTGKIEFVYRPEATAVNSPSASIGITETSSGSGNYLSVNNAGTSVSSTTEANVTTKPASGKTYTFIPPVPTAPTNLTFSEISTTSMTLNWLDNSGSVENGFVIYKSTDGVNYIFNSQTAPNTTSSIQSGLTASTTYYWKVFAVSEGGLSTALTGNQATTAIKTFTGTGNFSDATKWTGGTLPLAGDNLIIDGTCTVDNNAGTDNLAYGTLTIGTASGRTLNWAAGGTNRLNVSNVSAGSTSSILNMTNGGTLIIRGTLSSTNLTYTPGTGTIEIQSTMTLPAAYTTYNNLILSNSSATISTGVVTTVNGSLTVAGTLQLAGFSMTSGDLQGSGIITSSSGTPTLTIGGNNTSTTFSGIIGTGAIALTKNGTGTLTLSGTNTYTGITTINTGTIKLDNASALGSALSSTTDYTVVNGGAVLDLNGTNYSNTEFLRLGNVTSGGTLINSSTSTATYAGKIDIYNNVATITADNPIIISGQIASSGPGYNKAGTSTLTVTSANSTWSYLININAGTLIVGSTTALGSSSTNAVTVNSGAVLDLNGFSNAAVRILKLNGTGISGNGALINSSATAATFSSNITLGSTSSIVGGTGTIAVSGTITGATFGLTLGGAAGGSVSGVIGGTGTSVSKIGAGTWILSGLNTYTGSTIASAGILRATNNTIVASANGPFGNNIGALFLNGGTIQSNVATFSRPITVTNTGSGLDAYGSARTISSTISNATVSTVYKINIGGTTVAGATGQNLLLSGVISNSPGTISLSKIGTSSVSLSNQMVSINDLEIIAGTFTSTSSTLTLSGNFSNSSTFIHNSGTVTFNGSSSQSIGGTTFNNLTINNNAGVTLTANVTINATLTLSSGIIAAGVYTLIASSTASVSRTSGHVYGNFRKYIALGGTSATFEVGDASNYTPVLVAFASVTTAGNLTVSTTSGDHPNIGSSTIYSGKSAKRYWTLTNSGIVFTNYNATFTFVAGDLDAGATTSNFIVGRYNAGWTYPTVGTKTLTTTQAKTVSAFGDFQLGEIYAVKTFTGTGNFSDPTRWTGGTLPVAAENLLIDGTCTVDNNSTTDNIAYGSLTIGTATGRTLNWAVGGTNRLNVMNINAGNGASTLNMTNGGTLINRGTWSSTNLTFTPGEGTIEIQSSITLPATYTTYNNLTINGSGNTVSLGAATSVNGNLIITAGTFNANNLNLNIAGNWTNNASTASFTSGSATVSFNSASSQSIGGTFATNFNNLTIANTTSSVTLNANANIGGNLSVTNGTFDLSTYNANRSSAGGILTVSDNAILKIGGTNAYPANYSTNTLGALSTIEYSGTTQTIKGLTYSNLTISGPGANSKTADSDITVNGILKLSSANASATQGCLEMSTYILTMGADATTIGTGDVTGIVKRTSFMASVPYTFGNQYTTITFNAGGIYPSQIQLKIEIGTAPPWKTDGIKRLYDFLQADAINSYATTSFHYLDSEINGNDESKLAFMIYGTPGPPLGLSIIGGSNHNTTENWVSISNANIQYLATSFDVLQIGLTESDLPTFTWNGSTSTAWNEIGNWTPLGVPVSSSNVIIPDAASTPYDPTLPSSVEIKTLTIEAGGILNAVSNEQLTINGDNGAWSNIGGTFNAASSNVIFTNADATMAGTTNFHDLTIATGAALTPGEGNMMRIAGSITNNGTLRAAVLNNIIEFNGASQAVINPNGAIPGYSKLILSGSGTKTMPGTALSIAGDFTLSGSTSATAGAPISIGGNVTIGSGTTFNLSTFNHSLAGNLTNNGGTFTASTGTTTFNGTTLQTITSSTGITLNNLSITNTNANVTLGTSTNCSIAGNLTINSGVVFDLAANSLTAVTGSISNSGTILTQSTSVTPLPSGKTWNGTLEYTANAAQTIVAGTYNNLTMSGSGGTTAVGNITVNGILNLSQANPSATKGILDMGSYTVLMGPSSTTIGQGDVTGIVRRTTIVANTTYTYGNQYTTINFPNVGTLPSELSLKISIGTAPTWKTGAIKRIYDLVQSGGSNTQALLYSHYLDSELNGNDKNLLVDWVWISPSTKIEYGRSSYNTTDNWVAISNVNVGIFSSVFGAKEITLSPSEILALTWNGSVSTSWVTANNWTPNGAPSDLTAITIPDAATTNFDLALPNIATCGSITLENGAILNANSGAQLTINGGDNAWNNKGGTFNAGTSTLIFKNAGATMAGSSDFYNVTINSGATLALKNNAYLGISGTLTNNGTLMTVDRGVTTVEYKGGDQTVVVPNPNTDRYSSLILSGSGTKTMPSPALSIYGDFTLSGTVTATAGSALTIAGNMTIGTGCTFITGNNNHFISGNFTNNGTFTTAAGYYITMNGTSAQSMGGSSTTTIDNLTIDNSSGVTLSASENVTNILTLTNGNLSVGANTLGINGTISKSSGNIDVGTSSSLSFGGTTDIILPTNLFTTTPIINNLTINRSGLVTLGNQNMTINGLLDLPLGTFSLGANSLILAGSSLTRTSGFIDAGNTGSTLTFTNSSPVTLPDSLFTGAVNNLTINGSGGITSKGDFTVNGILNLQSANPSPTKGSLDLLDGSVVKTITMGASATTMGQGDVTGKVRRTTILPGITYTFGNQYTTAFFLAEGTLPSQMSLRISIGNSPTWRSGGINRVTELIQTGGSNTKAIFKMHYLHSELNGNNEDHLVLWVGLPTPIEYGRSAYNTTENWVKISNVNLAFFSSNWDGLKEITLDEAGTTTTLTWNGSLSDSWTSAENWTPNEGPSDSKKIIIPDASTTPHDPTLPIATEIKGLNIEPGGILNSSSNAQLTINGGNDAWNNTSGIFNPNTSNVIFTNAAATISGINNFYDVTIDSLATLTVTTGNIMRIAGTMTNKGIWYAVAGDTTTVEYNGADQTIVIPNPATQRYSNLILSGNGTKTMPFSPLNILGDFSISNTAMVTVNAALTVYGGLSIASGCQLSVSPTANMDVSGTITNNAGTAGLILQSGATGTASLIHHTDNVPATVKRYITGEAEAWHFLSSPVSAQSISGSWLPSGSYGNGTGYDLYVWNEPTFCWIYNLNTTSPVNWNTVHPGSVFTVGRGYLYSVQAVNPTKEFVGNLNNGSLSYELTAQGTDLSLLGFNLVGNPYPSSADWQAISGWTRTSLVNSGGGYDMWIWNPAANNYGVCNSLIGIGTNDITRFIPPMQGYFVQAASDGALSMNNDVRVLDGASDFKDAKINPALLSLSVQSESDKGFDEVQILFGYPSNQPGARKLFSNVVTAPGLFMPFGNEFYTVRYLTDTIDNPTIPVMFKPGQDGNYSLSCNFETNRFKIVMLEDRQMHFFQNLLSGNSYHFRASVTDDENRFVLHFIPVNNASEKDLPVRIYSGDSQLVVDLTAVDKDTEVLVYDILGRKLLQQKLKGKTLHHLSVNNQVQVAIVHLSNPDGGHVQKLTFPKF